MTRRPLCLRESMQRVLLTLMLVLLLSDRPHRTVAQTPCDLCGEGLEMSNPNGVASIPNNGDFPCFQLLELAETGQFDAASCAFLQTYVFTPCGCGGLLGENETAAPTVSPSLAPTFGPPPSDCYSDLDNIFLREQSLSAEQVQIGRTYILCPDTAYFMARLDETGQFVNGYTPFLPRPNVHYQCGATGSSSNNCRILDGTYAIISFQGLSMDAVIPNVTFQGLSIESSAGGALLAALSGSIHFVDCIFKNHENQGIIILQYPGQTGRYLLEPQAEHLVVPNLRHADPAEQLYANYIPQEFESELNSHERSDRQLQGESDSLLCTFSYCVFEGNQVSALGYPGIVSTFYPTNHLVFEDCIFRDNEYANPNIQPYSYAIMSMGNLTITNTCFDSNHFLGDAPVTAYGLSSVELSNNYVMEGQGSVVECSFVAVFENGIGTNLTRCETSDSSMCQASLAPTFAPQPSPVVDSTRSPVAQVTLSPVVPPTPRPTTMPASSAISHPAFQCLWMALALCLLPTLF